MEFFRLKINFWQAQNALTHHYIFLKPGGIVFSDLRDIHALGFAENLITNIPQQVDCRACFDSKNHFFQRNVRSEGNTRFGLRRKSHNHHTPTGGL